MIWRRRDPKPALPPSLSRLTNLKMTCLCGDVPEGLYELTQLRHLQLGFNDVDEWQGSDTLTAGYQVYTALQGLRELTNLTTLDVSGPLDSRMPMRLSSLARLERCIYLQENALLSPGFSLGAQLIELTLHCLTSRGPFLPEPGEDDEDVCHWAECLLSTFCLVDK